MTCFIYVFSLPNRLQNAISLQRPVRSYCQGMSTKAMNPIVIKFALSFLIPNNLPIHLGALPIHVPLSLHTCGVPFNTFPRPHLYSTSCMMAYSTRFRSPFKGGAGNKQPKKRTMNHTLHQLVRHVTN